MNPHDESSPDLIPLFDSPGRMAREQAEAFCRLPPDERWRQIFELMEMGMKMIRESPRRAQIERLEDQENAWKERRAEIFRAHGV